ncbi:hypothetical protein [Paraburkholderia atlantica]|uniref:hypothetical protein n=1 Tax=Paraburkholderia atlantica TaxID=2654982 RepID=UPI00037D961C|nr:hypothetical protein [Paraburkholderia atlantica]
MNDKEVKKGVNKPEPIFLRDTPEEFRAWISTFFSDAIISVMEFGMTVGLELTRHLSIVNGAGLAGVTALYSATELPDRHALLSSAGWFLAGLALAILTFLIMYWVGSYTGKQLTKVVSEWVGNVRPFDPERVRLLRFISLPTWGIGLMSFGCFLVGAIKVICALKIQL